MSCSHVYVAMVSFLCMIGFEGSRFRRRALAEAEERIEILKKDIEKLHLQWREAQNNYERQVAVREIALELVL